jgi:hypothetical protein
VLGDHANGIDQILCWNDLADEKPELAGGFESFQVIGRLRCADFDIPRWSLCARWDHHQLAATVKRSAETLHEDIRVSFSARRTSLRRIVSPDP